MRASSGRGTARSASMTPVDVSLLRPYRWAVSDNHRWERFECRPGDIFVCTPPKCGTTWMQTILASLLWPDGDVPGQVMTISPWIDANFFPINEILARLEAQSHRRFIKTHTPADGIPWFDRASYIVVGRDGRDAFMSLCHHYERFKGAVREELNARAAMDGVPPMPGWDGDVHRFFGTWLKEAVMFHHIASFWRNRGNSNLAFVHYNDLKADLAGEMSSGRCVPRDRGAGVEVGRRRRTVHVRVDAGARREDWLLLELRGGSPELPLQRHERPLARRTAGGRARSLRLPHRGAVAGRRGDLA